MMKKRRSAACGDDMKAPRTAIATARVLFVFAAATAVLSAAMAVTPKSVAVPFFELEDLQIAGDIALGRYWSLDGRHVLYAVKLDDGTAIHRIDDVGRAPFDFDGERIVYAPVGHAAVALVDLRSRRGETVWTGSDDVTVAKVRVFEGAVVLVIEQSGRIYTARVDDARRQLQSPALTAPSGSLEYFISDTSVAVVAQARGETHWSRDGGRWDRLVLPPHVQVIALAGDRLIALDRASGRKLLNLTLRPGTASDWTLLYESTSAIDPASIRATHDQLALTFVERDGATASLVWVPMGAGVPIDRRPLSLGPAGERRFYGWSANAVAWTSRRDGRLFLFTLHIPPVMEPRTTTLDSTPPALNPPERNASHARALNWLTLQLGPAFPTTHGRTARLVDSYEDGQRTGWIYDAALASITFAAWGKTDLAAALLAGLEHLQHADGSWVSSYHPDDGVGLDPDRYVGAMAWAVMAVNFFEWDTGDNRFAPMARRALAYMQRFRIVDSGSDLRGAFAMGPSRPRVVSTEHNIDCYTAFLWRGRLDRNALDLKIAADIKATVFRRLFGRDRRAPDRSRFFHVGSTPDVVHLDVQTWAMLAFGDGSPNDRLDEALRTAERLLTVRGGQLGSVSGIVGLDDSERPSTSRKVWAEGTEGMVAALLNRGETGRALRLHGETARYQSASGGIPYATENDHGWSTAPSVAATGWFLLNGLNPLRNPFNPDLVRSIPSIAAP
jgi:hypothetical protein